MKQKSFREATAARLEMSNESIPMEVGVFAMNAFMPLLRWLQLTLDPTLLFQATLPVNSKDVFVRQVVVAVCMPTVPIVRLFQGGSKGRQSEG